MGKLNLDYILLYLIDKLNKEETNITTGRTRIQKLMYFFSLEKNIDLDYSLFHYGTFSFFVSSELDKIESKNLINSEYSPTSGYSISNTRELDEFITKISGEDIKIIDKIVDNYKLYLAKELAIIATAIYIKKEYGVQDDGLLIQKLHRIKPEYSEDKIQSILHDSGVINSPIIAC